MTNQQIAAERGRMPRSRNHRSKEETPAQHPSPAIPEGGYHAVHALPETTTVSPVVLIRHENIRGLTRKATHHPPLITSPTANGTEEKVIRGGPDAGRGVVVLGKTGEKGPKSGRAVSPASLFSQWCAWIVMVRQFTKCARTSGSLEERKRGWRSGRINV
jgi:hypothetical protein